MYECNNCGCKFEEPKLIRDDECGVFPVCPLCGDDDYELLYECEVCGEYFEEVDYDACPECLANVKKKLEKFLGSLTTGERKVFDSLNFAGEI